MALLPALLVSALASAAPPNPAGAKADPDQGLARAYYRGLQPRPFQFQPTGERAGNILWLVVDALRPDHMGAYGYTRPTTPFLDSLAKESFVFLHAYANAPWTRPSTASMLTGLLPSQHRTQTERSKLPPDLRTLPQDLKALGYQTAAVVANGNGSSIAGLDRGFDHYLDPANHFKKLPTAAQVYDAALEWLAEKRDPKKPFFLFVFVVDPHDPYHAPPEYERAFLPKDFKGEPRRRAHWEYQNDYPAHERASMKAVYDAAIRYTDDQTKRFFEELTRLGVAKDLTWLATADHGDGFGEHGYYLHAYHHYDEIIRVPLLFRTPAWRGGGHAFHPVQHVDLLPTLVKLAGGKPRPELAGVDLTSALAAPVDRARPMWSEYNTFGIRRSSRFDLRYRVILQLPADKETFLSFIPRTELLPSVNFEREVLHVYDRAADPRDARPLSPKALPQPAAAMVEELRQRMLGASAEETKVDHVPVGIEENLKSLGYVQ